MCEMHVLNAYEGLGQGTALNVARDEVRHIQRGMAASLELVLLASAEWADPMKGQNGALLSAIQEPLEEAPPSGAGAISAPWLLHTNFLQAGSGNKSYRGWGLVSDVLMLPVGDVTTEDVCPCRVVRAHGAGLALSLCSVLCWLTMLQTEC